VDIARRLFWLAVLGAVAAGAYVAVRLYARSNGTLAVGVATTPRTRDAGEDVSAEAGSMVVASMESLSPTSARVTEGNGAAAHLVGLQGTPGTDAWATQPVAAPPRRRRLSGVVLAALGTLVGVAAIAVGAVAVVATMDSDSTEAAQPSQAELISLLSKPATERIPLEGSGGRIVLAAAPNGRAYLILDGLGLAPSGKTYQAWVILPGAEAPAPAGLFEGSELIVPLAVAVQPGAVVAITIEQAGGVPAPTSQPTIVASV